MYMNADRKYKIERSKRQDEILVIITVFIVLFLAIKL